MTTPLESIKTPLEGSEKEKQGVGSQEVRDALKRAFILGQEYWRQVYSQYSSDWKRADKTAQQFKDFQNEFSSRFD